MEPDVSVLTPSRNYRRFLADAVESVRLQTGVVAEHIVQDACSTDGTVEYLESCDDVYWRSEPDAGQSDGLNRALASASGRWVAWLNADEFYLPGALQSLVAHGERTGADVVFGDATFVDEEGRLLRLVPQHAFSRSVLRTYGVFIPSCAVLFRRSVLQGCGWDTGFRRLMDWALYLRLSDEGRLFRHLASPIGVFRVHGEQVTAAAPELFQQEYDTLPPHRSPVVKKVLRRLGSVAHAAMKVENGAYLRQARVQSLRGESLRWFDRGVPGVDAVTASLIRLGSGRGAHGWRPSGTG